LNGEYSNGFVAVIHFQLSVVSRQLSVVRCQWPLSAREIA